MEFLHRNILNTELPKSDAFILSDILHYMPKDMQEKLITKCIENLQPEGRIIIRDGDYELKRRHFVTRLSEFFSTRLGFNLTAYGKKHLYFPSKSEITDIFLRHGFRLQVIDQTRFTSNLVYIAERD